MRIPSRLIWDVIGDFFKSTVIDDARRGIEGLWQAMSDTGGDAMDYIDYYKRAKSIFDVEAFAPYGDFPSTPLLVNIDSNIEGHILGYRNGYWCIYTEDDDIASLPTSGNFRIFDSSIPYTQRIIEPLQSGGTYICLRSDFSDTSIYDAIDNPSFLFSGAYDDRFESVGSRDPDVNDDGTLAMRAEWVNQIILSDRYHIDSGTDWRQVYRFSVTDWDSTTLRRTLSINSFGDSGPAYEARLEDQNGSISASFGAFAHTSKENLVFDGNTITRTRGSWIGDGFEEGYRIIIARTQSNNGTYTVTNVTSTVLTVAEALTTETSAIAVLVNNLATGIGSTSGWRASLQQATLENPVAVEFVIEYSASSSSLNGQIWVNGQRVEQSQPYRISPGRRKQVIDTFNQFKTSSVRADFVFTDGKVWDSSTDLDFTTDVGDSFNFIYQLEEPLVSAALIRSAPYDLAPDAEVISQNPSQIVLDFSEEYANYEPPYARIEDSFGNFVMGVRTESGVYSITGSSSPSISLDTQVKVHPWYTSNFSFRSPGIFSTAAPLPYEGQFYFIDSRASELGMYERYGKLLRMPRRDDSEQYLDALRGMYYGLRSSATPKNFIRAISAISGLPYVTDSGSIRSIERFTDELGAALYDRVTVEDQTYDIDPIWRDRGLLKPVGTNLDFLGSLVVASQIKDWKTDLELIRDRVGPWRAYSTFVLQIPAINGTNATIAGDIIRMLNRSKSVHTDYVIEYNPEVSEVVEGQNKSLEKMSVESIPLTVESLSFDAYGEVVTNDLPNSIGTYVPALDSGLFLDETNHLDTYSRLGGRDFFLPSQTYSLVWAYEGVTDTLVTYANAGWVEMLGATNVNSGTVTSNAIYLAENGDVMRRSINNGKSWSLDTVTSPPAGNFIDVDSDLALNSATVGFWQRGASFWSATDVAEFIGSSPLLIKRLGDNDIVVILDSGADTQASFSSDNGVNFDALSTVLATSSPNSLDGNATDNVVVGTDDGLMTWDGSSWAQSRSGTNVTAVHIVGNTVIQGDSAGNIYIDAGSSVFLASGSISDIQSDGAGTVYAVSGSNIYRSTDSGATWTDDSPTTVETFSTLVIGSKARVAAGTEIRIKP